MFYKKNTQDVLKSLNTSFNGLSKEEAQERLKKYGYNELKEKDFGGRQEETRIQRKEMLKEWFDYVIKENDAYSNTQFLSTHLA